jgi:hypothetical protein
MDGDLRLAFYAGGGFCNRHAWLFHERVTRGGSGAPVADIYGSLPSKDLERLAALRDGLAEYHRKRDYRYADEPKGAEQSSWTDVIRRYVGDRRD